jgi:hypothetical protein
MEWAFESCNTGPPYSAEHWLFNADPLAEPQ